MEWKVPSHCIPSTTPPISAPMRSFISRAALLVKVTARICARPRAAGGEDMREPRGQHARLAGARAGQHQHRAVERLHGLALLGVEPFEIRPRCRSPPAARARRCRRASAPAARTCRYFSADRPETNPFENKMAPPARFGEGRAAMDAGALPP